MLHHVAERLTPYLVERTRPYILFQKKDRQVHAALVIRLDDQKLGRRVRMSPEQPTVSRASVTPEIAPHYERNMRGIRITRAIRDEIQDAVRQNAGAGTLRIYLNNPVPTQAIGTEREVQIIQIYPEEEWEKTKRRFMSGGLRLIERKKKTGKE